MCDPTPADMELDYLRWKDEQALAQYEADRQQPDYAIEDDELAGESVWQYEQGDRP